MLTEAAPAKINLTLHVTGRWPDGYHLLDSLVVFAGAHDRITASPAPDLSLTIAGPFAAGLSTGPGNLVIRAAEALAAHAGVAPRAALHLEKNLPVASGIGGGSSDAAAALRVLARLWNLPAPDLHAIAAALGADVPVCLDPTPRRMTGIGEVLSPVPPLPPCGILLVNPGEAVATQAVFQARQGSFSTAPAIPPGWPDAAALAAYATAGANDLQDAAISLCPAIQTVLEALAALPACLATRMSGSGATCFALFETPTQAAQAATLLQHPNWWRWGGPTWPQPAPLR